MKSCHLLLVDDNALVLEVLTSYLAPFFSVTTARNGVKALAAYNVGHFDAVVTDYEMPEMNGLSLCIAVSPTTPVYVISAISIRQQALDAGAMMFFDKGDVLSLVEHLKDVYGSG